MTVESIKAWIKEYMRQQSVAKGQSAEIPDDVNLVELGYLDSQAFVGLIAVLESHFGIVLDLINQPAENLVRVGSLAELVAKSVT